jgi:competence protein ComEC
MLRRIIIIIFVLYNLFYLISFSVNKELARLIFFDIGQGDSALLISPGGKTVLIDGGPSDIVAHKISAYLSPEKKTIDWMILSHDHRDHYQGLIFLSAYYKIKNYIGPLSSDLDILNIWLEDLKKRDVNIWPKEKNIIQHNLEDNCYFQILSSPITILQDNVSKNNSSLAVKINCWQIQALLIGDAEKEAELLFLEYAPEEFLQANIFKANHHGSKTSNKILFLKAVAPKYTIISAGLNNQHQHPHKETLDNFKKLNIIVFRTDRDGDIEFLANKRELYLK